jgi:hypothetical protein
MVPEKKNYSRINIGESAMKNRTKKFAKKRKNYKNQNYKGKRQ